jgi:nucleotide-binding universal stress UspA family protein
METILIATDFSAAAKNAVNYGADLAKFFDAKIVLLNIFSLPLGGYDNMAPMNVIAEMKDSGTANLNDVASNIIKRLGYDPGIECVCESGSVVGIINSLVSEKGADLVVMGMVGQAGAVKRKLIGSTSLSAARNLNVPVVIVPEKAIYKPIKHIDFACDFSHDDDKKLYHSVRAFAAAFGASVEIVQVRKPFADVGTKVSEKTEGILRDVDHKKVVLEHEDPAQALEVYFKVKKPDMVLINPGKHNLFHNLFSKSLTQTLAFQLEIPLLVFHS